MQINTDIEFDGGRYLRTISFPAEAVDNTNLGDAVNDALQDIIRYDAVLDRLERLERIDAIEATLERVEQALFPTPPVTPPTVGLNGSEVPVTASGTY